MIKTPLKQTDLFNVLMEVVQVVEKMSKFTLAMGETVTYIFSGKDSDLHPGRIG